MDWTTAIPWIFSAAMLVLAIITLTKNSKKDQKAEFSYDAARFDGIKESLIKANIKLEQICATTNETRTDIKVLNKDMIEIDRRVTVLEGNMETLYKRFEELKGE